MPGREVVTGEGNQLPHHPHLGGIRAQEGAAHGCPDACQSFLGPCPLPCLGLCLLLRMQAYVPFSRSFLPGLGRSSQQVVCRASAPLLTL